MAPYERLEAWKVAHQLALAVYLVTSRFPGAERYGITAQSRRAALSIPCNIVEGSAKRGAADFRRYLDIARASLSELGYLLRFARDLGLLQPTPYGELTELTKRVGYLTWRLYSSLRRDGKGR